MVNANEIRFGVEIETTMPTTATRSVANPTGMRIGRYHHGIAQDWLPGIEAGKNWKAENDSSIQQCRSFGRDRAEVACEFVSPILSGSDGLKNVVAAAESIKSRGGKTNTFCGVHVTVSFPDDAAALARLICLVANHETALYAASGTKNRQNGRFCKSIKPLGSAKKALDQRNYLAPVCDRYSILNLTHMANGGKRVEFRCFSGSLNPVKLVAWICLCLSLVEKAQNTTKSAPWESSSKGNATYTKASGKGATELARMIYLLGWTQERALSQGMKELRVGVKEIFAAGKAKIMEMGAKYDAE